MSTTSTNSSFQAFEPQVYATRRAKFIDFLPANSACLILANETLYKNGDTEISFRQDSNFWYLTGINEPDAALLIIKGESSSESSIFVREKIKSEEIWAGYRLGLEAAKALTNADKIFRFSDLILQIELLPRNITKFYFKSFAPNYSLLRQNILQAYPKRYILELCDPDLILGEMRLIKESVELDCMRRAAEISILGHLESQKMILAGNFEYQAQAALEYQFKLQNTSPAYPSIVASGPNATILHYTQNDRQFLAGDLVLIDAACEYGGYSSDITRTYVVDGKYSDSQKLIYQIVLKAHHQALETASISGKTFKEVHVAAVQVLIQGLIDLGLLSGSVESNIANKDYLKYYMHGTSHWLGLDTHDLGEMSEPSDPKSPNLRILKPNMVLTVEPGLYFDIHDQSIPESFRGIGIRLEDDILITDNGIENLTAQAKIEI